MLLPPPVGTVTLDEIEIDVTVLAQRYAEAIGEPVEVLPALRHRAVAIFARNEPWDRVMAAAGEATGFRLARKDGRLRLEATRFFTPATLEKSLNARAMTALREPSDVASAARTYRATLEESRTLTRELAKSRPYDREKGKRLGNLRQTIVGLQGAASPTSLVLARFFARGGRLPLGQPTVLSAGTYIGNADYTFITGKRGPLDVSQLRIAVRLDWSGLEAASRWGEASPEEEDVPRFEHGSLDPRTARIIAESGVGGTRAPRPRFLRGWLAADYLGWIHSTSKRLCAAPALRIAVGHESDNGLWSLGSYGYRLEEKQGAIIATHELGEGLWPHDFRDLDRLKTIALSSYTSAALTLGPAARTYAASGDYVAFLGVNDLSPLGQSGPMLRFLGASHPADVGRLTGSEGRFDLRLDAARMQAQTIQALARLCAESDLAFILQPPDPQRLSIGVRGETKPGRLFFLADRIWESVGVELPLQNEIPPKIELRFGDEVKVVSHIQPTFSFEGRGSWGDGPERMRAGPLRYTISNGARRPLDTEKPGG